MQVQTINAHGIEIQITKQDGGCPTITINSNETYIASNLIVSGRGKTIKTSVLRVLDNKPSY